MTLTHEPFQPHDFGEPFKLQAVRPVHLKCTGCHTTQLKLMAYSKGKVNIANFATQELHPLSLLAFHWLQSKQWALIGWQMKFIHLKYNMLNLEQTG